MTMSLAGHPPSHETGLKQGTTLLIHCRSASLTLQLMILTYRMRPPQVLSAFQARRPRKPTWWLVRDLLPCYITATTKVATVKQMKEFRPVWLKVRACKSWRCCDRGFYCGLVRRPAQLRVPSHMSEFSPHVDSREDYTDLPFLTSKSCYTAKSEMKTL